MDAVQLANINLGENNSVRQAKNPFSRGTILIFLNQTVLFSWLEFFLVS